MSNSVKNAIPLEDQEWGRAVLPENSSVTPANDSSSQIPIEDTVEIAIIGGGLAGLALAIGLQRANIDCRVFERAPQLRSISQGILAIQPNGMKALEQIHPDVPGMIERAGCERLQLIITNILEDGTVEETTTETGEDTKRKYGRTKVGITWHKMQQLLASLLPSDKVVTSRSLHSYQEDDSGVTLIFEDHHTESGISSLYRVRAKAVLACDGVFSAVRNQMIGDDPIYFGQLNWGTVIETAKVPAEAHPPNAVHYFMHEGDPRWMSMLNDGGSGQTFWQFRVADAEKALSLSQNKGRGGLGLPGVKEALLPLAEKCELVARALQAIPEENIFERSIVGRLPAQSWLSEAFGRVALVGDAAHGMHPNIAQGANSSFESAAAAVDALKAAWEQSRQDSTVVDWSTALRTYQQKRKPRADIVQRWSNLMGVYQATGDLKVPQEYVSQVMDWIVGQDLDKFPSTEILNMIIAFDPLSQPGVSKIQ